MADQLEQQNVAVVEQGQPETQTVDTAEHSLGYDLEAAHKAAEQFLAERDAEEGREPRPRDEKGRFASTKPAADAVVAEPAAPAPTATPAFDPLWAEAAKQEGLTDTEIAGFKSANDVQDAIALRRVTKLRSLGIDPMEFAQYRQWRDQTAKGEAPQNTQKTEPAVPIVDEFKLDLNEDDLAPEIVGALKKTTEYVNSLKKGLMTELEKERQKVAQLEQQHKQSAEAAMQAQREAQLMQQLEQAVTEVPDMIAYFGKPSEIERLAQVNHDDPKVLDFEFFVSRYAAKEYRQKALILGESPRTLMIAMRDAWLASPFSKLNGAAAKPNSNGASPRPGSVVRSAPRNGAVREQPDDTFAAQYDQSLGSIRNAWREAGGNPFNREL